MWKFWKNVFIVNHFYWKHQYCDEEFGVWRIFVIPQNVIFASVQNVGDSCLLKSFFKLYCLLLKSNFVILNLHTCSRKGYLRFLLDFFSLFADHPISIYLSYIVLNYDMLTDTSKSCRIDVNSPGISIRCVLPSETCFFTSSTRCPRL